MASTTRHPRTGRRRLASMRARRAARRETPLVLTPAQQEFLALHGFGPTAPPTDFDDPEVRTRFVGLLRECGALAPAPHAPASAVHSDIARAG